MLHDDKMYRGHFLKLTLGSDENNKQANFEYGAPPGVNECRAPPGAISAF